jgi:hypothetical protein
MIDMKTSTKITHPPCSTASDSLYLSANVCPSWHSTRRMLMGVPMQLMTVHACTASHSRCTSPSGQPAHDCGEHWVVLCTFTVACCEWKAAAKAPTRTCVSHAALCDAGAAAKAM